MLTVNSKDTDMYSNRRLSIDRLPFDDYNGIVCTLTRDLSSIHFPVNGSNGAVLCEMETSKLHCHCGF